MSNKNAQKSTINKATGLTPQQEQACIMLASGESYTAVAERLDINRGTLYKWQSLPTFECYYNLQCKDYKDGVKNGLLGLHKQAMDTIAELMVSGNENTRLRASMWVIDKVCDIKIGEVDVRGVLQKQCTSDIFDFDLNKFNERAYQGKLKEYGLSEDI